MTDSQEGEPVVQPFEPVDEIHARIMAGSSLHGRVITVRIPLDLHERLKAKARAEGVSLNWLCTAAVAGWPLKPVPPWLAGHGPKTGVV